jgi:hypothetical protein
MIRLVADFGASVTQKISMKTHAPIKQKTHPVWMSRVMKTRIPNCAPSRPICIGHFIPPGKRDAIGNLSWLRKLRHLLATKAMCLIFINPSSACFILTVTRKIIEIRFKMISREISNGNTTATPANAIHDSTPISRSHHLIASLRLNVSSNAGGN